MSCKPRLFAKLHAFLAAHRDGQVAERPTRARHLVLALLHAVLILFLVVSSAPASPTGAPEIGSFEIRTGFHGERLVFATRAELGAEGNEHMVGAETTERVEYSTVSPSGPWTLAAQRAFPKGSLLGGNYLLRRLAPATHYYARAEATSELGTAEATLEFTTSPVSAPEITEFALSRGNASGIEVGKTYANYVAHIETNGADAQYHFEYATSEGAVREGKGTSVAGATGSITLAEEFAEPEVALRGLTPETTYYLRGVASDGVGHPGERIVSFKTISAHPTASVEVHSVTGASARLGGDVETRGFETHWHFELADSASGPWTPAPSAAGTIAAAQANENRSFVNGILSDLNPGTVYYVRLIAENEPEPGVRYAANSEDALDGTGRPAGPVRIETAGPPHVSTFTTHTFVGGSGTIRALGSVDPATSPVGEMQTLTVGGAPTGGTFTLTFEGDTTGPIPFNATSGTVQEALVALPSIGDHNVTVQGSPGGPYEVYFQLAKAGLNLPQITADASGLVPLGTVTLATVEPGLTYDTHYHFEYVSQAKFEQAGPEGGWVKAQSTPEVDLGPGEELSSGAYASTIVGADLPGLQSGMTYRYRLTASNTTPGNPVIHGPEQTLTVPMPSEPDSESCPNEAVRTGLSARLPDCRAYEQVTPVEKAGSPELVQYGLSFETPVFIGEGGNHFLLESPIVKWGTDPGSNESAYLFSRASGSGWQMTSATPQPKSGSEEYFTRLHSPDLTQAAVEVGWNTVTNCSPDMSLAAGQVGGPYTPVISMARSQVPGHDQHGCGSSDVSAWIAASADFSKLVFWTEDHKLLGPATGTASGADLYEYSGGHVRQLNVDSAGATIGMCGALMVQGVEGEAGGGRQHASPHALSANGSRVFFDAVPSSNCNAASHLYMRVNGLETVDLGESTFLAANAEGTKLLLEHVTGETRELLLYNTETKAAKLLFSINHRRSGELASRFVVSEDFTAFYFKSGEQLTPQAPPISQGSEDLGATAQNIYRYDIATENLSFVAQVGENNTSVENDLSTTPDGRDLYFISSGVAASPGGGEESQQVYRYDSSEEVVQCMSCASPFNPEPKLSSLFAFGGLETGTSFSTDGVPDVMFSSENGDYVFFDALSALVPSDVNGEAQARTELSAYYSPSSDVYEWRRDGVDGCVHAQGCLGLISSGQYGHKVMLLGTTRSGNDVFFTTNGQLVSQDKDTTSDIYDARIGGGFPEPPRPVECEGDACSTPFAAPNDLTPSSATFQGAGNVLGSMLPEIKPKSKLTPKKKKPKKRSGKAKPKRKAKKAGGKAGNSNGRRSR